MTMISTNAHDCTAAAEYPDPCPENEFGIGMREGMGYWNSDKKVWKKHEYLRAHCVDNGYRGYGL